MKKDKIGLALSGGGYRATIFHLGTFKKLKELDLLDKIDVISSNSGGSITAASYSLYHEDFNRFENVIRNGVKKEIVGQIAIILLILLPGIFTARYWVPFKWPPIVFSGINIVTLCGLIFFQFKLLPISKFIEYKYDRIFFKKKKLKNLSSSFKTTINSTNIETGRIFYFSRESMSDSTYLYPTKGEPMSFEHGEFPIARAVMASSCVPGAFSPVRIKRAFYSEKGDFKRICPKLVDGGVYDNQGIHKLTFPSSSSFCKNVIVSDAGSFLSKKNWSFNSLFLLVRTGNIFMSRIKNFQMMANMYRADNYSNVAFQSLAFDLNRSLDEFMKMIKNGHISNEVLDAHGIKQKDIEGELWNKIKDIVKHNINHDNLLSKGCNEEELLTARNVGTGLSKLNNNKINALVKHAEAITELQVKLFLPHILQN